MPRLILLLAVIGVIYFLLHRAQTMPPHKRRAEYIKLGLGIVLVATTILAATGRSNLLVPAFTALLVFARQTLPLLLRLLPMHTSLRGKSTPAAGQTSTVETVLLRMQDKQL